jgi:hypothetical protein
MLRYLSGVPQAIWNTDTVVAVTTKEKAGIIL